MTPPFPPKPTVSPLVRRSLFAAALSVAGCQKDAIRIGPQPRIGPPPIEEELDERPPEVAPADAGALPATVDAAPAAMAAPADAAAVPVDAAETAQAAQADAGKGVRPAPGPIRIGMYRPPRIGPPELEQPELEKPKGQIRIGASADPLSSTLIRAAVVDARGRPLARQSLRIRLPSGTRIVSTDAEGAFTLDGLPPGEHAAVVHASGFAPIEVRLTAARQGDLNRVILQPVEE